MAVSTRLLGSNGQYSRYPLAFFLDEMRRLGLRSLDFVPQVPISSADTGTMTTPRD
ncbi:MAG: hypothetical protein ACLSAF_03285 [Intestinimonas sp.]